MSPTNMVKRLLDKYHGGNEISEINKLLTPIFNKNPDLLTQQERNVVNIEGLEREVNHGGFEYYFRYEGMHANETVHALKEINSTFFLGLLESAIKLFPNGYIPTDSIEREDLLDELEEEIFDKWDEFDSEFYEYKEDIIGLIRSYILKNIENFR